MKVLVIGSGGREHALAWKIRQSLSVEQVFCCPGNAGIARDAVCRPADLKAVRGLADLAAELGADLTVIGPDAVVAAGLADELLARGMHVFGPQRAAAQLESSKIFAKEFLRRYRIPTADFVVCEDYSTALQALGRWGGPVVLKADGLAAGKGVVVASEPMQARAVLDALISGRLVGEAGHRVVLEEKLTGEESSFHVLSDGNTVVPLAATQDHKAVWDDDLGPNTGGMGAYCDDSILSQGLTRRVLNEIITPTFDGLRADGIVYRGVLYVGLMITEDGPKVLEFNARFGDPETQALLFRFRGDLAETLLAVSNGTLAAARFDWEPGASVCVVACSDGYPGAYATGKEITGLEAAEALGVKVFHAGTIARDGRFATSGGRVLGVTARGRTLDAAVDIAYNAVSHIHFEGMHYRRDIARKGLLRAHPL
jgi:phosphoribosylamine--glycine ligase